MIGRFVSGAVHLTRLNAEGTAKAGTGNDKLMFGPVSGSPMVIRSAGSKLIICEGIEDGLSMAIAVPRCAVWVAGSAAMMPKLIPGANGYQPIMAFDLDKAGLSAYRKGLSYRPDLRSIRFPKQLDANVIIRQPDGVERLRDLISRRPTFHR